MLKKRIAASLIVRDGIVVQSIGFKKFLPIGIPSIAIEFLNQWGIDEIILLDITATKNSTGPDFALLRKAAIKSHVPLTIGGGIKTVDQIKELMQCGADKISINQSALFDRNLISAAAHIFGDQCVVVSIDALKTNNGYFVFDYLSGKAIDISIEKFTEEVQNLGAGEILVNSVNRDGSYMGYDLDLINSVCDVANVPIICCGGAKNANDFLEVFSKTKVSAASAANFFHFTEHSVNITKSIIKRDLDIRLDTYADYERANFDKDLRLIKKSDAVLESMLFTKIEKEII